MFRASHVPATGFAQAVTITPGEPPDIRPPAASGHKATVT